MIIKYYTLKSPSELFIIDNAQSVRVIQNIFSGLSSGPDASMVDIHVCYDSDEDVHGKRVQFIDFTQDEVRHRLSVYGKAYICNDQGKTIEPVDPVNGFEHQPFIPMTNSVSK